MWTTVTVFADEAWSFFTVSIFTVRCVEAPGEPTTVVVVADEIAVFVRPGVIVPDALSTHDAWTDRFADDDVVTRSRSDVEVSRSTGQLAVKEIAPAATVMDAAVTLDPSGAPMP